MADVKQIPHLLRLLDDDSPTVREMVTTELLRFGATLQENLSRSEIVLTAEQRARVNALLQEHAGKVLRERWQTLSEIEGADEKLEYALGILGEFLHRGHTSQRLSRELDALAEEFVGADSRCDAPSLAAFLFRGEGWRERAHDGLRGVAKEDYYRPENSDLLHVLESGSGIPISLACIFLLVGRRLGIAIRGCNLPGHFLASARVEGTPLLFDCYHGGRIIDEKELASLATSTRITMADLLQLECEGEAIILRVLRNLENAFEQREEESSLSLIQQLIFSLSGEESDPSETE